MIDSQTSNFSKYTYSHGFSLENIATMLSCMLGAFVILNGYFQGANDELWILVVGVFCLLLALFTIDLVFTTVDLYADGLFLYVKPRHVFTFKKFRKIKRNSIKRAYVKTTSSMSRYGRIITHVVMIEKTNREKVVILSPKDKKEASRIKTFISKLKKS